MNDPVLPVRLDQRQRWEKGERVLVEAYLAQHPWLRENPDGLLDLIYNEIVLREEARDSPRLQEYLDRFPQFAEPLRRQFAVHWAIEAHPSDRWPSSPLDVSNRPSRIPRPVIPGYEILEELGRGGMGVVYRARQLSLNRLVALKVIRTGSHASHRERERFRTEAEAVARLQHPNIVQIHQVGEHEGLPYLCLEYVSGPSLDRANEGKLLPPGEIARLLEILARAISHAHQHGIVHRDLKPANILLQTVASSQQPVVSRNADAQPSSPTDYWLLTTDYSPKIADFGLAKLIRQDTAQAPTQALIGTPNYMAPEQASKGVVVGPPADVYALGAILYELLTGQPPFQGESPLEILQLVLQESPVPPSRVRPGTPRDLETICLKCLEKDPGKRYTSALDLAEDLRRFLAHEPILARPAAAWERAAKAVRRRPAVAGLIAVSAIAVATLALVDWRHRAEVEASQEKARSAERQDQLDRLEQARLKQAQFAKLRGDALFHGIHGALFPEDMALANLSATRAAVENALALVGINAATESGPVFDSSWREREKAEVVTGCYQLLLLLADATANSLSSRSPAERRQELGQAVALLDRAAKLAQPTRSYYTRRAQYLALLGDEPGAQRERDRAAAATPASTIDFFLLGDERLRMGDTTAAAQSFHKALLLEPEDFWSQYFLAICHLKLQRFAEAEAGLTKCLTQRPDLVWARLLRGFSNGALDKFDLAEADFQATLASSPIVDVRYAVYVSRGLQRYRRRQIVPAVADLRNAIDLRPEQFHARVTLAKLYQVQKKWKESSGQLERVLRLNPPASIVAECHAELSRNLYSQKRYREALEAAESALTSSPSFADGRLRQGLALLELRQFQAAVRSLDRFLAGGGKPGTDFYRARGRARAQLQDYLGAKEDYTRALEIEPDSELWAYRGWAYFFADAWKPAARDFEEAIRLDPDNGMAYAGRGLARAMLGQSADAALDAEEALRRSPSSPEMMHNIACVFALAAAQVEKNPNEKQGSDLALQYRERSLQALRKTLSLVPANERSAFWRDKIVPDVALDSIRQSSGFKEIAGEMARGASGADP